MRFAFIVLLAIATVALSQTPEPAKVLAGNCTWGKIEPTGPRSFKITGNALWTGIGIIDKNGNAQIFWTHVPNGRTAVSVYGWDADCFFGSWGWSGEAYVTDDGDVCGEILTDRFAKMK